MMWSIVKMVINFILAIAKFLLIVLVIVLIPFLVVCLIRYIHYKRLGYKIKPRKHLSTYHKPNFFKRLFWDFPDRFVKDKLTSDPDRFPYTGLVMICGEQGSGKSISLIYILLCLKKMFPAVQIYSNISISFQDGKIESPDDIIFRNNGFEGCIKVLDEIHSWFNSKESKDFPPEMITEVSQQRKQTSLFIGTCQVFMSIAKAIRVQTYYLVLPMTICGCLTILRVYKIKCDQNGEVIEKRHIKTCFFVQNDEYRDSYDTYEKVKRLSMKGWKPRTEQLTADNTSVQPVIMAANPVVAKDKK